MRLFYFCYYFLGAYVMQSIQTGEAIKYYIRYGFRYDLIPSSLIVQNAPDTFTLQSKTRCNQKII